MFAKTFSRACNSSALEEQLKQLQRDALAILPELHSVAQARSAMQPLCGCSVIPGFACLTHLFVP